MFSSEDTDPETGQKYIDRFVDGISFATWSDTIIDPGDDLVIGTSNRSLEDF